MVVNGANKETVMKHFNEVKNKEKFDVDITIDDNRSLISVQGPEAVKVLESALSGLKTEGIPFMSQFDFQN